MSKKNPIEKLFNTTPAEEPSNSESRPRREMSRVPDGTYSAVVDDFSVFSSADGDYFVSWWFKISNGAARGESLQRFSMIGERTVGFIKKDVRTVTGEIPEWDNLFDEEEGRTGDVRAAVLGAPVVITQKTAQKGNKEYINVYIDRLIDDDPEVDGNDDEDEIPF